MALYVNTLNYAEHVALWKGDVRRAEPVLVRMHAINVLDEVLGDGSSGKIGRASCWERVYQYVYISVVDASIKKKLFNYRTQTYTPHPSFQSLHNNSTPTPYRTTTSHPY